MAFSILERIEFPATRGTLTRLRESGAFSILERIEFPATNPIPITYSNLAGFQYPRTDRIPCNYLDGSPLDAFLQLSVSSNGSNSLQLLSIQLQDCSRTLSVSSNGSNSLQPRRSYTRGPPVSAFSILERIEFPATDA